MPLTGEKIMYWNIYTSDGWDNAQRYVNVNKGMLLLICLYHYWNYHQFNPEKNNPPAIFSNQSSCFFTYARRYVLSSNLMKNVSIYDNGCLLLVPYSHIIMAACCRATCHMAREVHDNITNSWQRYRDGLGCSYIISVCVCVLADTSNLELLMLQSF